MSIGTCEQLAEALGPEYRLKVDPCIEDHVHVVSERGDYLMFVDLTSGVMEATLYAQWLQPGCKHSDEGFSTEADCVAAMDDVALELQSDWELSGWIIRVDGLIYTYTYEDKPGQKFFKYELQAMYTARTLGAAVKFIEIIRWIETR